ncbi:uncharacterized protein LOC130639126 [Hydractinia symbiolongicarpus]|uniref:uncharacterized protein LOC130639126 n=1 Tax=Hydractinia symbiolongicarpus TaxID=13093 RepID=UPI00254C9901|nr:uncharacterized protein LOC130639126 [Hydractinia symbiolongicarpus]
MLGVKKMSRTMTNRRIFRTLARDNCGESMEPGEEEIMYFGYKPNDLKKEGPAISCASLKLANVSCTDSKKDEFYHWITFLFVYRDFKGFGYGKQFVEYLDVEAMNLIRRPVRTESAYKAVGFFEKCGFKKIAEPRECVAGSSLFRFLYLMEKKPRVIEVECWDSD